MAKTPIRMKTVVYSLAPSQQKAMAGLWKDLPKKLTQKVSDNWLSATLLLGPFIGLSSHVRYEPEKERREYLSSPHLAVLPHNYKGIQGKSCDESFF